MFSIDPLAPKKLSPLNQKYKNQLAANSFPHKIRQAFQTPRLLLMLTSFPKVWRDLDDGENRNLRQLLITRSIRKLTFAVHLVGVASQPTGPTRTTLGLVKFAPMAQSSGSFTSGGQTAELSVLHHGSDNPVDFGIPANGLVGGINHDDLIVLIGRILTHPIRAEHSQTFQSATHTLLKIKDASLNIVLQDNISIDLSNAFQTSKEGIVQSSISCYKVFFHQILNNSVHRDLEKIPQQWIASSSRAFVAWRHRKS